MENQQTDMEYEFVKSLKKKIDLECGVGICLWRFCYSFMKIKVIGNNVGEINKHKILKIVSDEMNGFTIKNKLFKNKLTYVFERKRDRLTPHGKVKWLGSDQYYNYGHDQAGSSWRCLRCVRDPKYELMEWAED